jgi:hypothetical protein
MNILNGDSAAGSFKAAFRLPGSETLVFRDVLSCGPLHKFKNMQTWIDHREHFWTEVYDFNSEYPITFHSMPRDFHICIEELKATDHIKLWIGCALSDQLVLVFLVFLLECFQQDLDKLSVFQFNEYTRNDKDYLIHGLGELRPEQIKEHPLAFKLKDEQIRECLSVWDAITDDHPQNYLNLINTKTTSLPILNKSLKALFYRFPKLSNGLSHWDETIVSNVQQHGPKAAKIIGYTMSDGWWDQTVMSLDTVGDSYLFHRLKKLASTSLEKPLLSVNSINLPLRKTTVDIQEFGISVFKDEANTIASNGIDDWIGGIHLDSSLGKTWFRKDDNLVFNRIN